MLPKTPHRLLLPRESMRPGDLHWTSAYGDARFIRIGFETQVGSRIVVRPVRFFRLPRPAAPVGFRHLDRGEHVACVIDKMVDPETLDLVSVPHELDDQIVEAPLERQVVVRSFDLYAAHANILERIRVEPAVRFWALDCTPAQFSTQTQDICAEDV